MGIYKSISEVPDRYRLSVHTSKYEGRDVWEEYLEENFDADRLSEWREYVLSKADRYWKAHMSEVGRHHALAQPRDIEKWCSQLLENCSLRTLYEHYWIQIEQFYSWLQYHTNHPHVYNPVLMAAVTEPVSQQIWEEKISYGRNRSTKGRSR